MSGRAKRQPKQEKEARPAKRPSQTRASEKLPWHFALSPPVRASDRPAPPQFGETTLTLVRLSPLSYLYSALTLLFTVPLRSTFTSRPRES